jgi:hypothetical protein
MIRLKKFVSGSEFSYTNVQFIDDEAEMTARGIPIIIGDGIRLKQIVIITTFGEVKILSNYAFGIVEVGKFKLPNGHGYAEYRRLNVNGDISFSSVVIIPTSDYDSYGIPTITEEQVSFVSDKSQRVRNYYVGVMYIILNGIYFLVHCRFS